MAENFSTSSLLGAMDQLWFHQVIFFSEPISQISPKKINNSPLSASFNSVLPVLDASSSSDSLEEKEEEEDDVVSCNTSTTTTTKEDDNDDDASNHEDEQEKTETHDQRRMIMKQRLARLNLIATDKIRSKSSSPSSKRRPKSLNNYTPHLHNPRIFERTTSLKGFHDLELEEVQGFMDLGFKFNKNHITPRIVTLVPGLQRLGSGADDDDDQHQRDDQDVVDDGSEGKNKEEDEDEDETKMKVMKPYLSEAWRIDRPDSPLLRLRMARVSSSSDAMKQHLKLWARTVATHVTTNQD